MEEKDLVVNNFKSKIGRVKYRVKQKTEHVMTWCKDNKEIVITCAPIIATGIVKVINISMKNRNIRKTKELKENYIWDNQNGCYYELKHEMSNSDKLEMSRRKANGEHVGDILDDMGLLK